jgi:hypothetical protein
MALDPNTDYYTLNNAGKIATAILRWDNGGKVQGNTQTFISANDVITNPAPGTKLNYAGDSEQIFLNTDGTLNHTVTYSADGSHTAVWYSKLPPGYSILAPDATRYGAGNKFSHGAVEKIEEFVVTNHNNNGQPGYNLLQTFSATGLSQNFLGDMTSISLTGLNPNNPFELTGVFDPSRPNDPSATFIRLTSNVISNDGGSLVAQGGGNFNYIAHLISNDGGGLVAQGGGNLVAQGAGNLVAQGGGNLVAQGGGNFHFINLNADKLVLSDPSKVISEHGAGLTQIALDKNFSIGADGIFNANTFPTDQGTISGNIPPDAAEAKELIINTQALQLGSKIARYNTLSTSPVVETDIAGDASTNTTIAVNGTQTSSLKGGGVTGLNVDFDWFKANLVQGTTYIIDLEGADTGAGALGDPLLKVYGPNGGTLKAFDNDSGFGLNSQIVYTADANGTFFLEVSGGNSSGDYRLTLKTASSSTAPVITSLGGGASGSITIPENQATIGTMTASDGQTAANDLHWFIAGGADASKFGITETGIGSGMLYLRTLPDYERPVDADSYDPTKSNIYEVNVKVVDGSGLSDTQAISVFVSDVAEPSFAQSDYPTKIANATSAENTSTSSYILNFRAFNPNNDFITNYTLTGEDARWFSWGFRDSFGNPSGQLFWHDIPDYETPRDAGRDNVYHLNIVATNSQGLFDTLTVNVTVTDQPDAGVIGVVTQQQTDDNSVLNPFATATVQTGSTTARINLNTTANGTFTTASLSSSGFAATGNPGEWSKSGTASSLTSAVRALVFDPTDNQVPAGDYVGTGITLTVSDGVRTDQKSTTISVLSVADPVNHAPVINSNGSGSTATISINENTTAVTTVQATDVDAGQTVRYYISQDSYTYYDGYKFDLNATTGVLRFLSAPDYENPQSVMTSPPGNSYYVEVEARDSATPYAFDVQAILVNVTDVAEPEITVRGNTVSIADGDTTPSTTDFTDFGSVTQNGTALVRTFTVKNDGAANLTLGAVSLPTGFTLVEGLSTLLTPGASDTFQVRLDTSVLGTKTGQISFTSNDSNESPFNFSITGTVGAAASVAANDFNADGMSDVFWRNNSNGHTGIWEMRNNVSTWRDLGGSGVDHKVVGSGEFSGDQTTDLFWRNDSSGHVGIWEMHNGLPTWRDLGGSGVDHKVVGVGKFNSDATSDILWRNDSSGHVGIWEMHNNVQTWRDLGGSGVDHKVVGVGDFNGDGTSDILWRNDSSGHVGIWEMRNNVPTWRDLGGSGVDHKVVGIGDFNGDNTSDILWRNDSSGHVGIWEMHNSVPTWRDLGGSGVDHKVVGVGFYNNDTTSDIFWRNDSTGHVGIWEMHNNIPTWRDLGGSGVDHAFIV